MGILRSYVKKEKSRAKGDKGGKLSSKDSDDDDSNWLIHSFKLFLSSLCIEIILTI